MIISSARLLTCARSEAGRGLYNYSMYSLNEKAHLVNQLCEYNLLIGIHGYDEYEDDIVKWVFGNSSYTTEQVERMIKMRVFA